MAYAIGLPVLLTNYNPTRDIVLSSELQQLIQRSYYTCPMLTNTECQN